MKRLLDTENLLNQCADDLQRMKKLKNELRKIETNRKKLEDYYKNQYMEDYKNARNQSANLKILDQDSIWNTLSEQYQEKINIVKNIIKSI